MVYKPTCEPPITLETTRHNAQKWLSIIRYGEYGTVIQIQDDCEYRVAEILEDTALLRKYLGPYFRKYILRYIPIDSDDLIKKIHTELIHACAERQIPLSRTAKSNLNNLLQAIGENGFEIGLFISHTTQALEEPSFTQLFKLEHILEKAKNTSLIFFCEQNITYPKYQMLTDKCSLLFDNIQFYPLYKEADTRQFIRYHEDLWKIKPPKTTTDDIVRNCGGYLWLVSHVVRYFRDNPAATLNKALHDPLLLHKLKTIWNKFTQKEKTVIRSLYKGEIPDISPEMEYLTNIKVIQTCEKQMRLTVPLLSFMIEYESKLNKLHTKGSFIYLNEKEITVQFTPRERNFILPLLNAKTRMVSRETLAKSMWGKDWEEKYSDWAIDRMAYRLRQKLTSLSLPATLLKTSKRKGFIFG